MRDYFIEVKAKVFINKKENCKGLALGIYIHPVLVLKREVYILQSVLQSEDLGNLESMREFYESHGYS